MTMVSLGWLYVTVSSLFSATNIYGSSLGLLETHKNINAACILFILERIKIA